jgi:uncharacterized MnhB-related membrane protein
MSPGLPLDAGLALLASAFAIWIVAARQAFAAVVGLVGLGLVLSLAWIRLAAVDVALTEAAIGSGITGAVMLTAVTRLHQTRPALAPERCGVRTQIISAAAATLISVGLAALVLFPTSPAPTLASLAAAGLQDLGVGNAITGILLAYRSIDVRVLVRPPNSLDIRILATGIAICHDIRACSLSTRRTLTRGGHVASERTA